MKAHLVHVILDLFNQKTGEKEYIQKFTLSDWKVFKEVQSMFRLHD